MAFAMKLLSSELMSCVDEAVRANAIAARVPTADEGEFMATPPPFFGGNDAERDAYEAHAAAARQWRVALAERAAAQQAALEGTASTGAHALEALPALSAWRSAEERCQENAESLGRLSLALHQRCAIVQQRCN